MTRLNALIVARLTHLSEGASKHLTLYRAVLEAIEKGIIGPGDKLPTEAQWAEQLPVSLGTVQRAVRALTREGHLVRKRGLGTHVAHRADVLENPLHCRFLGPDGFLPVYARLIKREIETQPGPWAEVLGAQPARLLRLDRDLSIGDAFHVLSRIWVNTSRHPSLASASPKDLARRNIKTWLHTQHGARIVRIEQSMQTVTFEGLALSVTGMSAGQWGNRIDLVAIQTDGSAAMYQQIFIPPNPYPLMLSEQHYMDTPWESKLRSRNDNITHPHPNKEIQP
jgi:DNA-binding GntR family transcriptional regulator